MNLKSPKHAALAAMPICLFVLFFDCQSVCAASAFADQVILAEQGPGVSHANFTNPDAILGIPDYSGGGQGTGAFSLGAQGRIAVRMGSPFAGDGTAGLDLVLYEVGPAVEPSFVEVSTDSTMWFAVGTAPGGTFGFDLDAVGFGPGTVLEFVRVTDIAGGGLAQGLVAGADIDAIQVTNPVPEPGSVMLLFCGTALCVFRRPRRTESVSPPLSRPIHS